MLQAAIHGRLGVREDVLTSCVFGTLDLLPACLGLHPWLQTARTLDDAALHVDEATLDACTPRFWPCYSYEQTSVEPDLVLDCRDLLLIIEVKDGAGPSGTPTTDGPIRGQLGRQWRAVALAKPAHLRRLVYLTPHRSMPVEDMQAMVNEVASKAEDPDFRQHLYWLSWHTLTRSLARGGHDRYGRAIENLRRLLRKRGFDMFCGVPQIPTITPPTWAYGYGGPPRPARIIWSYAR